MGAGCFDSIDSEWKATLAALAEGVIPADEVDEGAKAVDAGARLAEKLSSGVNAELYRGGIETAVAWSYEMYGLAVTRLNAEQIDDLLGAIRDKNGAFFRQLRSDVASLYLSDPQVWRRIGFPGPSADRGGYPDFDQRPTKE